MKSLSEYIKQTKLHGRLRQLRQTALLLSSLSFFLSPTLAQDKKPEYFDMPAQEYVIPLSKTARTLEGQINTFHQPNDSTLSYYGSLEIKKDNVLNWEDYNKMVAEAPQIDEADIDGDSLKSTVTDQQLASNYFNGTLQYLPAQWNPSNREEKVSWSDKMLTIDKTDTITYIPGEIVSGDYAIKLYFDFQGPPKNTPEAKALIATKYDTTNLGRFNMPFYYVSLSTPTYSHGMNAVLVGDNPLNFYDWQFIEPQNDEYNHFRNFGENWNPPAGSSISIIKFNDVQEGNNGELMLPREDFVKFKIDSTEKPILMDYNKDKLLLTEPTVAIGSENPGIPEGYSLKQNYPNPFNPTTTIKYKIPEISNIELKLYNINGQEVRSLPQGTKEAEEYEAKVDLSGLSSGIYFYQLGNDQFRIIDTKKMTYAK